jgi:two-component system response regulator YesN
MLQSQMEEIRGNLIKHFEVSVSFLVSISVGGLPELPERFSALRKASFHRILYGPGAMLFEEDLVVSDSEDFSFMEIIEKIGAALAQGKTDLAKQLYCNFTSVLRWRSEETYKSAYSRLIFTLNETSEKMLSSRQSHAPLLEQVNWKNVESMDEVNAVFEEFFDTLGEVCQNRTSARKEEIVQRINELIDGNYADSNLSISFIAEKLGMSVSYLTKAYKEYTNRTVLEQITDIRMEKAEDLLARTSTSVSEIAKNIGVLNTTYFYKLFKACHNLTPSEYRKQNKKA